MLSDTSELIWPAWHVWVRMKPHCCFVFGPPSLFLVHPAELMPAVIRDNTATSKPHSSHSALQWAPAGHFPFFGHSELGLCPWEGFTVNAMFSVIFL